MTSVAATPKRRRSLPVKRNLKEALSAHGKRTPLTPPASDNQLVVYSPSVNDGLKSQLVALESKIAAEGKLLAQLVHDNQVKEANKKQKKQQQPR